MIHPIIVLRFCYLPKDLVVVLCHTGCKRKNVRLRDVPHIAAYTSWKQQCDFPNLFCQTKKMRDITPYQPVIAFRLSIGNWYWIYWITYYSSRAHKPAFTSNSDLHNTGLCGRGKPHLINLTGPIVWNHGKTWLAVWCETWQKLPQKEKKCRSLTENQWEKAMFLPEHQIWCKFSLTDWPLWCTFAACGHHYRRHYNIITIKKMLCWVLAHICVLVVLQYIYRSIEQRHQCLRYTKVLVGLYIDYITFWCVHGCCWQWGKST